MAAAEDDKEFKNAYDEYLKAEAGRFQRRSQRAQQNKFVWLNNSPGEPEPRCDLRSRIAVIGENGIGDEVFDARFAAALARKGREVIWIHNWKENGISKHDNSRLLPLFSRRLSHCGSLTFTGFPPQAPVTCRVIFSKELIKYFGRSEEDWTRNSSVPYIAASPDLTRTFTERYRQPGKKIVGVAWKSTGKSGKDALLKNHRGWEKIFAEDRCSFVSLQYGDTQDDINDARYRYGVEIYHDREIDIMNNLEAAAAQINACDVIISISTTTAHMAIAMDKKTLLLLPDEPFSHWKFPGMYRSPNIKKISNLSLDKATLELREIVDRN